MTKEEQELKKTASKVDQGKTKVLYFIAGALFMELLKTIGAVDLLVLLEGLLG